MPRRYKENLKDISKRKDHKELARRGGLNKRGKKHLKTLLMELLGKEDPKGEWASPVAQKLIQLAFKKNNLNALIEIIDRVEGKINNSALIDQSKHTHVTYVWGSKKDNNSSVHSSKLPRGDTLQPDKISSGGNGAKGRKDGVCD